jgi:hypothetical protein
MSATTKIAIDFVTEYKGRQNLKNAEKDVGYLGNAVSKLGKQFAAVFAVDKILEFGKSAVTAFAADNASAKILSNTLSNLGQAFADVPVESFITKLSELNGIAKTDLRSSFDTLVRSTGDASKAQDLLSLGTDISAGTGKNLSLVTTALAKAYGGNYAALSKLGAGISATLLKTKDFTKMQQFLAKTFKGDAAVAADTYQGKINRLKTSFEEFKITVGSGIVDAFANLGKGSNVEGFQTAMSTTATNISDMVDGLGKILGLVTQIGSATDSSNSGFWGKFWNNFAVFATTGIAGLTTKIVGAKDKANKLADSLKKAMVVPQGPYKEGYTSTTDHQKYMAAQAQILAAKKAQLAVDNASKKAAQDKLALERASLSLKLAGQTTDMQNIEIQAALQRGQTEQVTNVLLLQRAIINGNADQANILSQEVLKANGLVMDVNGNISTLANAKNPFADWPPATQAAMDQLKAIQDALAAIKDKTVTVTVNTVYSSNGVPVGAQVLPSSQITTTAAGTTGTGGTLLPSGGIAGVTDAQGNKFFAPAAGAPSISGIVDLPPTAVGTSSSMFSANPYSSPTYAGSNPINVTVNLNGQAVGNAITNAQVDQSASGINPTFQRSGYGSGALPW